SNESEKARSLFYSTNDYETAKSGNTGVFSYKRSGNGYDVYWIIDFDEGYAYSFTEGNDNPVCDKYKISSGDLNDRIILNINDAGYEVTWYLHFKYKNFPETLILNDHLGLDPEFTTTSLDDALNIRDTKTIKTY
ncbi:MAG: PASTA domain-containing protein, partial [Clostridia bacterium]|nr:PASTA domain-containing protein [Clostridia bacterium]